MKADTYSALLKELQKLQKSMVSSQIEAVRRDAALASRLSRLHAEAEVGGRGKKKRYRPFPVGSRYDSACSIRKL